MEAPTSLDPFYAAEKVAFLVRRITMVCASCSSVVLMDALVFLVFQETPGSPHIKPFFSALYPHRPVHLSALHCLVALHGTAQLRHSTAIGLTSLPSLRT